MQKQQVLEIFNIKQAIEMGVMSREDGKKELAELLGITWKHLVLKVSERIMSADTMDSNRI